ncbi:hypothetical protein P0082_12375 [Candidatus Haliotispira prima]|uniref:Alpha/beta hydrolase n=1 Tax=Candidatus Haliotispira prima TaxID=3034016 RepID=A0ABY8MGW6_9SPIO|nr:hypothetical protein P0082_12375 [Candidatus Haliotispira prima]
MKHQQILLTGMPTNSRISNIQYPISNIQYPISHYFRKQAVIPFPITPF